MGTRLPESRHRRLISGQSKGREREKASRRIRNSQILEVLGRSSFAEFKATRCPGTVLWCNFELAGQLGFDVPRGNQLTPDFHRQLIEALSFRAVTKGEDVPSRETVTMYADRYGGDGLGPALGAGRAGFLPYGNLYVKGLGFTPLFRHNDPHDFMHSHGGVHLEDCISEAVFGEVNENLFTHGSARIVAIIDLGKSVIEPSGRRRHTALAVRAGAQLRPGHLLGRPGRGSEPLLEKFIRIARATGQLVAQHAEPGRETPDVRATMLRIVDDHARTAAEAFRWRMIHGALSASNMEMSGAMLDLPTQSTQPRTAPVWKLDFTDYVFGTEHMERAFHLVQMYRKLLRRTPPETRKSFHVQWLNIPAEMQTAYRKHLQVNLLRATGLKKEVADWIQTKHRDFADRFADLILRMAALRNPGNASVTKSIVEDVAVADVFHLLGNFPAVYFQDPKAKHDEVIRKFLKPVFRGNRFHVAKKKALVRQLAGEFGRLYRELMNICDERAREFYGSRAAMRLSISSRGKFENQPLDSLYCLNLYGSIDQAISTYKSTGSAEVVREVINATITASLRGIDALLAQGNYRRLNGGGYELEMRTIEGISYSVRAWNDANQKRRLHVSVPVRRRGDSYVSAIPELPVLSASQIKSLRYRYTTDNWKNSGELRGRLVKDRRDGLIVDFEDLDTFPSAGRLGGFCYLSPGRAYKNRKTKSGVYVFAIPDRRELMSIRF